MQQLSREKREEVVQHYLLGSSYEEIVRETGVSHGTVSNIIKEVDSGQLSTPGSTSDRISDLRQLALDLRKKKLEPSHALIGLLLFERFRVLGISMELLTKWSELSKRFAPADFPSEKFFAVALNLHELEKSEGRPFQDLTEEYKRRQESVPSLTKEINTLKESKLQLSREIASSSGQLEAAKRTKGKLEDQIEIQNTKVEDIRTTAKELEEEKSRLNKQVRELRKRATELSAYIEGKEESLKRLNDISLEDEDLLRLRAFLENMSGKEGISPEMVKERFFLTLSLFGEVSDLEKTRETKAEMVKTLAKERSALEGQIIGLEKVKSNLEGEINSAASSASQKIQEVGQRATQQIEQQVVDIRKQLGDLFSDTLKAGEAVGRMLEAVRKGEESQKGLNKFLQEAQSRLEVRR